MVAILFSLMTLNSSHAANVACANHGLKAASEIDTLNTESNLWQMQDAHGNRGLFAGIVHITDPVTRARYEALKTLAAASDVYFSESDFGTSATDVYMSGAKAEVDFTKTLTPEQRDLLKQTLVARGLSLSDVQGKKPWYAFSLLSRPSGGGLGLDADVYQSEVSQGKVIVPLESMTELVSDFNSYTYGLETLLDTLCGQEEIAQQDTDLLKAFRKSDWAGVNKANYEFEGVDAKVNSEFEKVLVIDRNLKMLGTIKANLKGGTKFMSVLGVDHLPGKNGLIELLRKEGWTVTPVKLADLSAQATAIEQTQVDRLPELLPSLSQQLKALSDLHWTEALPKLKVVSSIEFYTRACGGYGCDLEAYYAAPDKAILIKPELLPGLLGGDPQALAEVFLEVVHFAQAETRGADWCDTWRERELQARRLQTSYLQKNGAPVMPINLGSRPQECH